MNQIMLSPQDLRNNNQTIFSLSNNDPRFFHIKKHLKMHSGDQLKMAVLNEGRGLGKIIAMSDKELLIEITSLNQIEYRPYREAVIALGRPKQMLKILEYGTQLGINKFQIIKCELSDKSYLHSPLLSEEHINLILIKGLSQSAFYYELPKVEVKKYFPRVFKSNCLKIALDPIRGTGVNHFREDLKKDLQFILGPERGFTDGERDKLQNMGFLFQDLGPSILKSELAFCYFMGGLQLYTY